MKVTTTPDDNPNAVVKKPCCKSKNISLVRAAFLFYQLQRLGHWNLVSFLSPTRGNRVGANQPIEMKHAAGEKRGKFCVHASQDQNYLSDRQRKWHEICKYRWESLHVGMHSQRTNEYRTRAEFPKTQLAWWQVMTTAVATTTTPQINDVIGWMRKNNHAARAARISVQFSHVVC